MIFIHTEELLWGGITVRFSSISSDTSDLCDFSPAGIDLAFYPSDSFDVQEFSSGVVESSVPDVMGDMGQR